MNREATGLAGARHKAYETLGSTNAEALALARAGERGPLWITAKTQSAGRGRRGSAWVSPPGNLYATFCSPSRRRRRRRRSCPSSPRWPCMTRSPNARRSSGPALQVKWPNDLMLGGAKLAGILIEGDSELGFAVAIGIGVNCAAHPPQTNHPATDLAAAGALVSPEQLLDGACVAPWRGGWRSGAAARASPRSAPTGSSAPPASASEIRVRLPERELSGRFEGLDEAGRLLLAGPDGVSTHRRRRSVRAVTMAQAESRNWCSRRSAASARSA